MPVFRFSRWTGVLSACDSNDPGPGPTVLVSLYTMTNAADANHVVVYDRMSDGTVVERQRVSAGGNGSGPGSPVPADPLMSQDAVVLSPDGSRLFVVNAGSHSVAASTVASDGRLTLVEAQERRP